MFKRKIEETIYNYYNGKKEKILVIDGARQVGKTYIVRKISKKVFQNYLEINLKDDFEGDKLFQNVKTTHDFYIQISALPDSNLNNADDTVVFLDEIQVYPHLLTMLKALNQEKRYTYIVSGYLLGITLKHTFIPMGSIDEVKMYPMDFEEFLWANNVGSDAIDYLRECFIGLKEINEGIHQLFLKKFKEYLISHPSDNPQAESTLLDNFKKMMSNGYDMEMDARKPSVLSEVEIYATHESGIKLWGRLDKAEKVGNDTYRVVDYKTNNSVKHFADKKETLLQGAMYAYILMHGNNKLNNYGKKSITVSEFVFRYLKSKIEVSSADGVGMQACQDYLNEVLNDIQNSVTTGEFAKTGDCDSCYFKSVCGGKK